MYGHDPSRTNFNPVEKALGIDNVDQLVQRWQSPDLGSNGNASSSAPVVANGKVYVGSSAPTGDNYFAFDAVTGAKVWSTNLAYQSTCFSVGIGSTAAVSGNLLVVGGGDDAYYGLDANTGAKLWRNQMNVGPSGYPWESPLIANGRVYLGMSSRCDDPSVRGEVRAVDLNGNPAAANSSCPKVKPERVSGTLPHSLLMVRLSGRYRRGLQRLQRPVQPRDRSP